MLESIRKQLKPSKDLPQVDRMISKVNSLLKASKLDANCVPGGSYAKGTILKDDFDIDLFVRFDLKYKGKDISELLHKAIASLKPERLHGSRDYFQVQDRGVLFEIIPVLKIKDYKQAANVTDMSPLHVDYVKRYKNLGDEVRLAKQFAKAAKVYGAESYIRGFSGHMLDLLIIYYGSFEQLIMQASVWGKRVIIDIEKHLRDPVSELNKSKVGSPIILVDPIQPDRNAAAAISEEKFEAFKEAAKRFIESPSKEFFTIKPLDIDEVKKKYAQEDVIVIKATPLSGKKDVTGAKVLKVFEHIRDKFKAHDFKILESGWEFGHPSRIYFALKKEKLSETVMLPGPPASNTLNAARFRKVHKQVTQKNGKLWAKEKRKYLRPQDLVKDLLKEKYIKDKVTSFS